jgi:hypothetical protein
VLDKLPVWDLYYLRRVRRGRDMPCRMPVLCCISRVVGIRDRLREYYLESLVGRGMDAVH